MGTVTSLEALRELPLLKALELRHAEKLLNLATEVGFERDQVIFREGEEHNRFYIILRGRVSLEITAPGRVFRVQTLQEGDELAWSFMLTEGGKHFQARALQPVRVLAFDGTQLATACREDCTFGFALLSRVLRVVSQRLHATRLRILEIYAPDAGHPQA